MINVPRKRTERSAAQNGRLFSHILRKEVRPMPITITLHIFGYTVTIRIKGRNRHSAK